MDNLAKSEKKTLDLFLKCVSMAGDMEAYLKNDYPLIVKHDCGARQIIFPNEKSKNNFLRDRILIPLELIKKDEDQ
jgi:hypothetical protein